MILSKLFLVSVTKKLDHLKVHGHPPDAGDQDFRHTYPAKGLPVPVKWRGYDKDPAGQDKNL